MLNLVLEVYPVMLYTMQWRLVDGLKIQTKRSDYD